MPQNKTKIYSLSCLLLMVALSLVAYLWWGISLITIILMVIGAACLLPVIYAWWLSRWIDKELDKELMSSEREFHNKKTESTHDEKEKTRFFLL